MANLVELFDNIVQMQNLNGVPLANGKMYVYALGRTRLMDTWSDVDGESLNSNPIILDAAGQCHCYVSDDFDYTLVVTDAYDNEIFSIDKYLYSQGSHSHADVAVAPSETIAVSSYHVGETTVYVPYLTGQLGKVYQGIDPIVVNNTEDKISAQHVPLGVQDPLYFVQDDEEGCIIGFSGQTVPEGVMTESALGFENDKITGYNGSAFSAGNEYEPGDNIDITNGVISGKDWSNEINDASANAYSQSIAWTDSQGYLTGVDLSEYAKTDFVISAIDSSTSGLLPTSAFATASGSFITALPSDLATTGWVDSQGYLTAVDIPESATWNATTQTVSANSAQWAGGTANPQIPVTSTSGISIFESGDKVYFNISADYATEDWVTGQGYLTAETDWTDTITAASANAYNEATAAIPAPFDPSYLSGQIDTKLDSAIYANDSGTFLTAHQDISNLMPKSESANFYPMTGNPSGFLTAHQSLEDYQTTAGMTAYQPVGDYLTTGDSANFYPSDNPSAFITGVDLTPYQTVEGMTAYQPVGDYLTTGDSANFYTTANESGFISEIPDTYLQNTDLSTTDGKVTAISGIPLAAGGEVPEGVMVESAVEYNAVNEISGYNGSAIAQYGAEKQWLVHDDTLVHASNSAQYALGVNLSAVAQLLGVDETVLWSGTTGIDSHTTAFSINEPFSSFNRIRFEGMQFGNASPIYEVTTPTASDNISVLFSYFTLSIDGNPYQIRGASYSSNNGTDYTVYKEKFLYWSNTSLTAVGGSTEQGPNIQRIVGIGRKS